MTVRPRIEWGKNGRNRHELKLRENPRSKTVLAVKDLRSGYGDLVAVDGISLEVHGGGREVDLVRFTAAFLSQE